ncbi:MAG: hypothetical protein AABX11_03175, partial [Nanoarchaeota archaeon]
MDEHNTPVDDKQNENSENLNNANNNSIVANNVTVAGTFSSLVRSGIYLTSTVSGNNITHNIINN